MRYSKNIILGLLFAFFSAAIPAIRRESNVPENKWIVVPNQIMFKLKGSATKSRSRLSVVEGLLQSNRIIACEPVIKTENIPPALEKMETIFRAQFEGDESPFSVAARVARDANIEWAEPRFLYHIDETPNDPMFTQQNFMSVIQVESAWSYVKAQQGSIVVAIVDGGTDINHPDLSANLWTNDDEIPGNGRDDDRNGFVDDIHGWNFATNRGDPTGLPTTPINADHGTHTAGLVGAVTNNNLGVAGVSWNATIMALNTSTIAQDRYLMDVYEGILYAIQNGAEIISCSFSEPVVTEFGRTTIQSAIDSGIAVLASAGNGGKIEENFPAAYPHVLCVGATTPWDEKSSYSSYGLSVDVMAPGDNIVSLLNNGRYGTQTGTSMSCPIVAGIVALVLTYNPTWTGVQAAEQVRVSADNIDDYNPAYRGLLGKGRVNAMRALTLKSPSIRILDVSYEDENHDQIIKPGETVTVRTSLVNYLEPAADVHLNLSVDDSYINLLQNEATLPALQTLEQATPSMPFRFQSKSTTPAGHPVQFKVQITSGSYTETEFFQLTILPLYGTVDVNKVDVTVTSVGRIGFADPKNSAQGTGFKYDDGPNLLFEGAIICGTNQDHLSNSARSLVLANDILYDTDFSVTEDGSLQVFKPGLLSDQESIGIFQDDQAEQPMNIRVKQHTYAFQNAPYEDIVIFRYLVENKNVDPLSNFYFGYFFDWDMDSENYSTNKVDYDENRKLGYAFDTGMGPDVFAGVKILTEGSLSFRAIYNDHLDINNPSWGLYDGFTDAEKWEAISGGITYSSAGPADISFVLASGPYEIKAKKTVEIALALLAGTNLLDLKMNADSAREIWKQLETTAVGHSLTVQTPVFRLEQNYPNPFNSRTVFCYQIGGRSRVEMDIYTITGQHVRTLIQSERTPGIYTIEWDGKDGQGLDIPSGTYICRWSAGPVQQINKVLYLK
jgi:serine protease